MPATNAQKLVQVILYKKLTHMLANFVQVFFNFRGAVRQR